MNNWVIASQVVLFVGLIGSATNVLGNESNSFMAALDCYQTKRQCPIAISDQFEPYECQQKRHRDVTVKRHFYKLTVPGEQHVIEFPLQTIPWLNQSMKAVRFHTALDNIDSRWASLLKAFKGGLEEAFSNMVLPSMDNLMHYQIVSKKAHEGVKQFRAPQYFSNPSMDPSFTDIFENNRWQTDEFFAQQRLAATCPFLLQRITMDGAVGMKYNKLMKLLNPGFDFNSALAHALNRGRVTLKKAALKGWLYVLYHEPINDINSIDDFYGDRNINMTSPISIFVRSRNGDLKVVAIQIDYKPSSQVFYPLSDPIKWQLAKAMTNMADTHFCQAYWHLSHVHFSSQVYCAVYQSHFSELHPLYQIMKYHCEGTTPHIALSWMTLGMNGQEGHRLSAIGHTGFVKLALRARKDYRYGVLSYDEILRSRGLDVEKNKLGYFPFRDDGLVLWNEFKDYAEKFVAIFYKSDDMIADDHELQSYVNEISADGKVVPFGGRGQVKDFPAQFKRKEDLQTFLTRFLWHIAMHASVNYPLEPFSTFVPTMPFKLHNDSRTLKEENLAYAYPDGKNTMGMIKFATLLGNLRVNRVMDHHDKMSDVRLKMLSQLSYHRFHSCIQKQLETRNAQRKAKGMMGFQYFEPKWMPNSIHV